MRLWVDSPATSLRTEDGRVTGAVVATPDGDVTVRARRGVLLAAGGFPHDVDRRRALFPRTPTGREHWTLAPPRRPPVTASAWGSRSAAGSTRALASPAAWCPVSLVPYRNGRVGVYPHIVDRGKPGLIGVLSDGRRFVNEADGYYQYTSAMIDAAPAGEEVASWLICDHTFQRRYPFGMSKPFPVPVRPYVRSGYLTTGRRPSTQLARRCGIDPDGLARTVARVQPPRAGRRGPRVRPRHHGVQPGLGRPGARARTRRSPRSRRRRSTRSRCCPAASGPSPGCGPTRTSRVLDADGAPIPGLYAAGSDQANVMGGHYPSGGINIGPAMTFGYVAGRHAAGVTEYEDGGS